MCGGNELIKVKYFSLLSEVLELDKDEITKTIERFLSLQEEWNKVETLPVRVLTENKFKIEEHFFRNLKCKKTTFYSSDVVDWYIASLAGEGAKKNEVSFEIRNGKIVIWNMTLNYPSGDKELIDNLETTTREIILAQKLSKLWKQLREKSFIVTWDIRSQLNRVVNYHPPKEAVACNEQAMIDQPKGLT